MKVKIYLLGLVALCVAVFMPVTPAQAQQDSALMAALVKKGVLTDQESEEIMADEEKAYSETGASKIMLSSSVKTIQFYGDIRLRYEMRDGSTSAGPNNGTGGAALGHSDTETMNRWRYRLRFGVKGDLYDDFFYGIRAATNPNYDRSGNVTFGHSDAAGPFGKDQSLLALDQVYLGWHATSDITLTGGQMPNPLYTTNLVWDDNLNPAGAAEQWSHTFDDVNVFATAGQFVYQAASGNGITNTIGGSSNYPNTFMYAEQVGFKYKFDDKTSFKAAATLYTYSGTSSTSGLVSPNDLYSSSPINISGKNNSPSYFNGPFVGAADGPVTNVSGINNLAVLEFPMEFDFTIGDSGTAPVVDPKDMKEVKPVSSGWSVPIRIFGDFAYNLQASERADQARNAINSAAGGADNLGVYGGTPAVTGLTAFNPTGPTALGVLNSGKGFLDQAAYQVGIEAGQLKKKGDLDGKLYWQSTGYYAVDPNLVDADIFNAATNMNGIVASVAYNWTDGLSSTVRYAYAGKVNSQLATPNVNQDLQLGDISKYNLFQADLMWKF